MDFPQQQWLQEHASILRYTYIACLVFSCSAAAQRGEWPPFIHSDMNRIHKRSLR